MLTKFGYTALKALHIHLLTVERLFRVTPGTFQKILQISGCPVDTGPSIVPYLCPSGPCQRLTATACSQSLSSPSKCMMHDSHGIARHQPAISKRKKMVNNSPLSIAIVTVNDKTGGIRTISNLFVHRLRPLRLPPSWLGLLSLVGLNARNVRNSFLRPLVRARANSTQTGVVVVHSLPNDRHRASMPGSELRHTGAPCHVSLSLGSANAQEEGMGGADCSCLPRARKLLRRARSNTRQHAE